MMQFKFYHQGDEAAKCYVADDDIRTFTNLMNYLCRAALSQAYNLQYETSAGQERCWKVTVKERGSKHPIATTHNGNLYKNGVIDFFGLHNSDVEWYRIEEIITIEEHINKQS